MTALAAHRAFLGDILDRQVARRKAIAPDDEFPPPPEIKSLRRADGSTAETKASKDNVVNYIPDEETIRNDYTAWYGVSGKVGAQYILGASNDEICEEYPALKRLMDLKKEHIDANSHPPLYLTLSSTSSSDIVTALSPIRFDSILITPLGDWNATAALPIRQISADPGFVFLWVGRGDQDGLERGRECLAKWGFRRAEDIVWVKTNAKAKTDGAFGKGGLFASQKEHCLMGIRGTVRRSTDSHFVHCNVDTDVMIWEDDGESPAHFPPYLYTLIESFCLGTRRLQLFPPAGATRRGWVTASVVSSDRGTSQAVDTPMDETVAQSEGLLFNPASYPNLLPKSDNKDILPFHPEIDSLRPKSPTRGPRRGGPPQSTHRPHFTATGQPAMSPLGNPGQFGQSPSPHPPRGGSMRGRGGRGGMPSGHMLPGQFGAPMMNQGPNHMMGIPGPDLNAMMMMTQMQMQMAAMGQFPQQGLGGMGMSGNMGMGVGIGMGGNMRMGGMGMGGMGQSQIYDPNLAFMLAQQAQQAQFGHQQQQYPHQPQYQQHQQQGHGFPGNTQPWQERNDNGNGQWEWQE